MKTNNLTKRAIAIEWFNNRNLENQFYKTIEANSVIKGDTTRHPNSLTGSEIEAVYGFHLNKTKSKVEELLPIGFDIIQENINGYYKAINNGAIRYNKDYSEFPEPKGKVIIYFNVNYSDDYVFVEIKQDGGTRTAYHGIVPNSKFLLDLVNNIR